MVIKGKVAEVLNERELVINKGSENGVKPDMIFKVIEPEREFRDPDTDELLGIWSKEKIRVKISEVHPKFSIGRTYQTYESEDTTLAYIYPRTVTKVRIIHTGKKGISSELGEVISYVEIGDPVIEVEEDK